MSESCLRRNSELSRTQSVRNFTGVMHAIESESEIYLTYFCIENIRGNSNLQIFSALESITITQGPDSLICFKRDRRLFI